MQHGGARAQSLHRLRSRHEPRSAVVIPERQSSGSTSINTREQGDDTCRYLNNGCVCSLYVAPKIVDGQRQAVQVQVRHRNEGRHVESHFRGITIKTSLHEQLLTHSDHALHCDGLAHKGQHAGITHKALHCPKLKDRRCAPEE